MRDRLCSVSNYVVVAANRGKAIRSRAFGGNWFVH